MKQRKNGAILAIHMDCRCGKIHYAKRLRFQPQWKSSRKYFHVALARSAYYFSIIKEKHLCSWKYFRGTFENHENHENLAQKIFPYLQCITNLDHWINCIRRWVGFVTKRVFCDTGKYYIHTYVATYKDNLPAF